MQGLVAFNNLVSEFMASTIGNIALFVELGGVIAVLFAVENGLSPFLLAFLRLRPWPAMAEVRGRIGRGLVLSLEIFVAADLLRTLPNPGLQEVIVLGAIAFLRTILGLSLEYEMRRLPSAE